MRRTSIVMLAVIAIGFLCASALLADSRDDLQTIKKAVKENPAYEAGKDVKFFKILVTDNKTGKDKVKITLPISVIEVFLNCAGDKPMKVHEGDCEIDIKALFAELKAMGPMALIEVNEEDETVKIWFE